jgi:hypothetical protein
MASPNKNMQKGGDYSQSFEGGVAKYAPFKMKAADHNNSPIEKNYGTPAHRGVGDNLAAFGAGTSNIEKNSGVGSGLNYGTSVGSSPAKGWFSKMAKKIGGGIKKFAKGEGALGLLNPLGRGISELTKKRGQGGVGDATASVVPNHGDESHGDGGAVGGVDPVAEAQPVDGNAMPLEEGIDPNAALA